MMKKKTPLLLGSLAVILAGAGILIGILLPKEKPEKHVGEKLPKALGYTQNAISKLEVTNIYIGRKAELTDPYEIRAFLSWFEDMTVLKNQTEEERLYTGNILHASLYTSNGSKAAEFDCGTGNSIGDYLTNTWYTIDQSLPQEKIDAFCKKYNLTKEYILETDPEEREFQKQEEEFEKRLEEEFRQREKQKETNSN